MQRFLAVWLGLVGACWAIAPAFSADAPAAATAPAAEPAPHLALLLPLESPALGRAAEALRQGFATAARLGTLRPLPLRVYASADEGAAMLAQYRAAAAAGAVIVVGPLTRAGVSALAAAAPLPVPALALNLPEVAALPEKLLIFALPVEAEARQAARLAAAAGLPDAIIIHHEAPLERRMRQAFTEEWLRRGGSVEIELPFSGEPAALLDLQAQILIRPNRVVFLALDSARARLVRPYIDAALPVYATSQVNPAIADPLVAHDLAGVRFVEMPWLIQPDHPAVMSYPRPEPGGGADAERLYAFGIDAYRLAEALVAGQEPARISLDGVTGRIAWDGAGQFLREPLPAQFRQGAALPDTAPAR